jgi:hypothetical protein
MKRAVLCVIVLAMAGAAFGTAQAPDILKYNGKTYYIHSNPLAPFLRSAKVELPESGVVSSGLWRGYIATWAIRDNKLYLDDVGIPTRAYIDSDAPEEKRFRSAMNHIFRNTEPKVATWFTGNLIVPTGELVEYVHMGYGSTYSSYMVATVVKGAVRQLRNMNREQFDAFRRSQFEAFKKTPEYSKSRIEANKGDDPMSDELVEQFLFQFHSEEYMSRIFGDH